MSKSVPNAISLKLVVYECRSAEEAVKQDPETTLKLVGGMRRENYAVGVFFLALSLGAANTVTQVTSDIPACRKMPACIMKQER